MKVMIVPHNPQWVTDYEREEETITTALAGLFLTIDHIGSTSVTGLGAKPIIDILVGLPDEGYLDRVVDPMLKAGYTYFKKYEPAMPYRRLFVRLNPLTDQPAPAMIDVDDPYTTGEGFFPLTNIHVIVKDTYHWTRHIAFRDFLRTHPEAKQDYDRLKRQLSQQEFADHLEYNKAKDSFVKEMEQTALNWYLKNN